MRIASLRAVLWRSARQKFASLGLFLGYVRTYCVPITTLTQNKRTWLLYLGDAQIITLKVVTTLFALASRNNATIRTKAFTLIVKESWRQFFQIRRFLKWIRSSRPFCKFSPCVIGVYEVSRPLRWIFVLHFYHFKQRFEILLTCYCECIEVKWEKTAKTCRPTVVE